MAKKQALTVKLRIEGVRETLGAFNRLPKEASTDLRRRTLQVSQSLAGKVAAAARSDSAQSALIAPTVAARRDRVPSIAAGGSKRVGRNRAPAWAILFGSEFGASRRTGWYARPRYAASTGRQYRPHVGKGSYWFFRTVAENQDEISRTWTRVADDIVRSFGGV